MRCRDRTTFRVGPGCAARHWARPRSPRAHAFALRTVAHRPAQHRLHPGGRSRIRGRRLLRPARPRHAEHRSSGRERRQVSPGLRQLRRLHRDARRAHHRPLSISPADRSRRAAAGPHPDSRVASGNSRRCPSLLRKAGYATTLVGKWHLGTLPRFGPLQSGYDHFYGFRSGALDYYSHPGTDQKDDLWDDDVGDSSGGLPDGPARRSCRQSDQRLRKIGPAILPEPAFQRAALAVGGAGRRSRVGADQGDQPPALRRRHAEDLSADDRADGSADWPRARRARVERHCATTPSSSSPATTAASGSPTRGRSPDGRPSCSKVVFAFRRSSPGPRACRSGGRHEQVAISMDWLPTLLAAAGAAIDPASPPDGINLLRHLTDPASTVPRSTVLALQGQRPARRARSATTSF